MSAPESGTAVGHTGTGSSGDSTINSTVLLQLTVWQQFL